MMKRGRILTSLVLKGLVLIFGAMAIIPLSGEFTIGAKLLLILIASGLAIAMTFDCQKYAQTRTQKNEKV